MVPRDVSYEEGGPDLPQVWALAQTGINLKVQFLFFE